MGYTREQKDVYLKPPEDDYTVKIEKIEKTLQGKKIYCKIIGGMYDGAFCSGTMFNNPYETADMSEDDKKFANRVSVANKVQFMEAIGLFEGTEAGAEIDYPLDSEKGISETIGKVAAAHIIQKDNYANIKNWLDFGSLDTPDNDDEY